MPNRLAQGFSLTELLVATTLVTVAAAAALPVGVNYLRKHQTKEAAQAVASQIQSARLEAVRQNSANGMTLSFGHPSRRDLHLTARARPGVRDRLQAEPPGRVIFSLPEGFQFEPVGTSLNALIFGSDGTVEGTELAQGIEGVLGVEGMNFVVRVSHRASGLTETILIARTGSVVTR